MPTHVLIVEGDSAVSSRVRSALQQRGHTVEETSDGRSVIDLARRHPPGVVVLAVELPGGQNGYLLVGKLKKDDVLKSVPVVIVGNPEGFEAHGRLKNRADEYLSKPLDIPKLVAAVGRLSGTAEETPLVLEEEATVSGDPDLDLIDAAFDDAPEPAPVRAATPPSPTARQARAPRPVATAAEDDFSGLAADEEGPTMVQFGVSAVPEPAPGPEAADSGEMVLAPDDLASVDDEQARAFAAEVRAAQEELVEQPGTAAAESGDSEELLRLHSELHAAEQLVGDLRDQHAQAEQRELELKAELARREGQLKALQGRLDQAVQERRRLEQALQGGQADPDEARRALEDQLAAAQRDLELNRAHAEGAERQLQDLRERAEAAEAELAQLREQPPPSAASEEVESLHARVAELEDEARKNRERVTRLYARLKAEERARENARKAVAVAGQLLTESVGAAALESVPAPLEPGEQDPGADEPAVA
ncbi:MAG TPA: response regulator [Myxococcaceae bacterium]|nr:response regulator [Myxococcaceae bacterium]